MRFLIIAGIVMLAGSIVLIVSNYSILNIEKHGKIVTMKIEKLPKSCIGSKVRYLVTYSYKGKFYDKATRGDYCERHYVGEMVDMKFLDGSKTILSPDESVKLNLISFAGLGLLGIGISISQWLKMRLSKTI